MGQILKVKPFVQHDDYFSHAHDFDYSLLELAQPVEYSNLIQAVILPTADNLVEDRTLCAVVGWGNNFKIAR